MCGIILGLHRSFKVSVGLGVASCRKAVGRRPGYTSSALIAQRGSDPGNNTTVQKLVSIYAGWVL